jgi:hypothetical protein
LWCWGLNLPHFWMVTLLCFRSMFKSHLSPKVLQWSHFCSVDVPVVMLGNHTWYHRKKPKIHKELRRGKAAIGKPWLIGQNWLTACFYNLYWNIATFIYLLLCKATVAKLNSCNRPHGPQNIKYLPSCLLQRILLNPGVKADTG